MLKKIIDIDPKLLYNKDNKNNTVLHYIAESDFDNLSYILNKKENY